MPAYYYKQKDIPFVASTEVVEDLLTTPAGERRHLVGIRPSPHYQGRDYDVIAYVEREKVVDVPKATLVTAGMQVDDKEYPCMFIDLDMDLPEGQTFSAGFLFDATDEGTHSITLKYTKE
ncbi:MAG: hypothetical protein JRE40_04695 [Deltaproteobacteria bacterium]|nr:hypothetical protein [Deltaproteobacteria bacterium]